MDRVIQLPVSMYFITPDLAVGRRADAEDAATLAAHGIRSLLSLCALPRPEGVQRQLSLDIKDRVALPAESIAEALEFIDSQIGAGRKVLIHCEMGISRSASIAVGYLHGRCGLSVEEALARVREANPIADPHPLLLESLRNYFERSAQSIILSGNENPLGPSALALAAIRDRLQQLHRYPDKDARLLRGKLACRLDVEPGQVLLGNGSCELIEHIARACLEPGDEAVIPMPSFPVYRSATRAAGGTVVSAALPQGGYDVEEILARVTPRTRLVMIGTPNNPTGTLLDAAALDRLVEALPDRVWLLVDEAYCDYLDAAETGDALGWVARGSNVIVVRSFSKAHGLAGLRIGYAVAPLHIAQAVERLRQSYNTNSLAQCAAAAAMDDVAHLARTRANNVQELARVQRRLSELGADYIPSRANFVLVRDDANAALQLAQAGIEVKDMERFGASGHFRVSIGLPEENTRFLQAFERITQQGRRQARQLDSEISQPLFA